MKISLRKQLVLLSVAAIAIVVSFVIIISYVKSRNILRDNVNNGLLPAKIESIAKDVNMEFQKSLTISHGMSADILKMPLANDSSDDEKLVSYLTHIKNTYNTTAAFYASNISERYYVFNRFLKELKRSSEKDKWFYAIIDSNEPYLYNLDIDENTNSLVVFLNYRIKKDDKTVGVVGVGRSLDDLSEKINTYNKNNVSKIYLLNETGFVALGGTEKQIRKPYSEDEKLNKELINTKDFATYDVKRDGGDYRVAAYYIPEVKWTILLEVPNDVIYKQAQKLASEEILIGILAIVIFSFILGYIINRQMLTLRKISESLLSVDGDLTFRLDCKDQNEIGDIVKGFNKFIEKLQALITTNKTIASDLAFISDQTIETAKNASSELAVQKEETLNFVESISQMSLAAQEVAKNAENATHSTNEANTITEQGIHQLKEMINAMSLVASRIDTAVSKVNNLKEASQQIEMILSVISSISDQTSLLALNAAIEAARAGEVGRGFAVVADEVRSLASKTQNSTVEISNVIKELQSHAAELAEFMAQSQSEAGSTMDLANKTESLLGGMGEITATINNMILQISSAAEEQSSVAKGLNENAVRISGITENVNILLKKQNDLITEQQEIAKDQKAELDKFTV